MVPCPHEPPSHRPSHPPARHTAGVPHRSHFPRMDGLVWDAQSFRQTHAFLALWGHEDVGVMPMGASSDRARVHSLLTHAPAAMPGLDTPSPSHACIQAGRTRCSARTHHPVRKQPLACVVIRRRLSGRRRRY